MARAVVIGGGFGGMATAARLAKQGHQVTLVERSAGLGGALGDYRRDGFTWQSGPTHTLLPAVIRDLFRKTGRPLEREVELVQADLIREHRFLDGTAVALPGGSRGVQYDAFEALGPGLGDAWCDHVASYARAWDLLRREYLERPWSAEVASKEATATLLGRQTLHRRLRRAFADDRLREIAAYPFVIDGHDPRNVPAWLGVQAYVEQRFASWTVPGGMSALGTAMVRRLETRKVTVLTRTEAHDLELRDGRVAAVRTSAGEIDADVAVCAIDPRRLPALARHVRRTTPALPPTVCHLGLRGDVPELPGEVVLHGDPLLVVRPGGQAPEGCAAWTVLARGKLVEDVPDALARHGIDVRAQVVIRVDRSPRELVEQWGGSPVGVLWQGRATVRRRLGPRTPIPGVYAAGAHATPGSGLPYVGLSAALVAQEVGRVDRTAG